MAVAKQRTVNDSQIRAKKQEIGDAWMQGVDEKER